MGRCYSADDLRVSVSVRWVSDVHIGFGAGFVSCPRSIAQRRFVVKIEASSMSFRRQRI
jgi:hypothetical protein